MARASLAHDLERFMTEISSRRTSRRWFRGLGALLCGIALTLAPGCATLTGLTTGAFTGSIDAPAQVYRYNRSTLDHHPEYWVWNILFFVPVGIAAGPLAGMAKGAALDVQWLLDQIAYDKAFNSYRRPSIWRPYTIHW